MKKIILIALAALTMTFAANAQEKSKKSDKISETKFDVNIHCDACKQKIEKNIPFEKGVKDVDVNVDAKTVVVKYDNTKTDVAKLQKDFEKLGYTAQVASSAKACCKGKSGDTKGEKSCCKGKDKDHKCASQCKDGKGEHKCKGGEKHDGCSKNANANKSTNKNDAQTGATTKS